MRRALAWFFGPGFPNPSNVTALILLVLSALLVLRGGRP